MEDDKVINEQADLIKETTSRILKFPNVNQNEIISALFQNIRNDRMETITKSEKAIEALKNSNSELMKMVSVNPPLNND